MKHLCVECGQRRKGVAFMKLVNGTLVYVCLDCWDHHDYSPYFTETSEIVKRMRAK